MYIIRIILVTLLKTQHNTMHIFENGLIVLGFNDTSTPVGYFVSYFCKGISYLP